MDWCLKVDDSTYNFSRDPVTVLGRYGKSTDISVRLSVIDLDLNGVEFSSLPSGLHTVEHDVV